jgi:hypothetical protein
MEEASDRSFPLSAKNRHRLEAYAPLAFRTVERFPKAIPGAIAVRYSITPLLHSCIHSRALSCTHSSSTFRY